MLLESDILEHVDGSLYTPNSSHSIHTGNSLHILCFYSSPLKNLHENRNAIPSNFGSITQSIVILKMGKWKRKFSLVSSTSGHKVGDVLLLKLF